MGTNYASSIKNRKEKIAITLRNVNMYRSKVKELCRKISIYLYYTLNRCSEFAWMHQCTLKTVVCNLTYNLTYN